MAISLDQSPANDKAILALNNELSGERSQFIMLGGTLYTPDQLPQNDYQRRVKHYHRKKACKKVKAALIKTLKGFDFEQVEETVNRDMNQWVSSRADTIMFFAAFKIP